MRLNADLNIAIIGSMSLILVTGSILFALENHGIIAPIFLAGGVLSLLVLHNYGYMLAMQDAEDDKKVKK